MQSVTIWLLLLVCATAAQSPVSSTVEPDTEPEFDLDQRIVGGRQADPGQFPYQVSLRLNGRHICGGSIVASNYVVTAAHCIKNGNSVTPASALRVQAGSIYLNSGGEFVAVDLVLPHPSYNSRRLGYDVALLRLSNSLSYNANIQPIRLATADPPDNAAAVTSGWGAINHRGPISNQLLYIPSTVTPRSQCQRVDSVICLRPQARTGVCFGDSGGPAVYNNQLIGVTNFIVNRCAFGFPDGFARVSLLRSWIASNAGL